MKNIFLISLLVGITITSAGCSGEKKNTAILNDSEFTQEEKTRPAPNVISVEETMYGLVDDLRGRHANLTNQYLSAVNSSKKKAADITISDLQTIDIGDLVLVEDLGSPIKDIEPYFYHISVVNSEGDTIAIGGFICHGG